MNNRKNPVYSGDFQLATRFGDRCLGIALHGAAALLLACLVATSALAAEDETDADAETDAAEASQAHREEADEVEEIIVTGSRLRRSTYTSIAPLQIISADAMREAGLVDAGDILQGSAAAGGIQVDLTQTDFPLKDGPGTVTINLRGLSDQRTLVLFNGRRLAPSGVEGAPTSPDIGILPGLMIDRYDVLLDGASSIYGSDAVAGVVNALVRKDFDGLEITTNLSFPKHDNGREAIVGASWGKTFDRGVVGVGVEWKDYESIALADRPWTAGCEKHYEIDEDGKIRTQDLFHAEVFNMRWDECNGWGSRVGRVFVLGPGGSLWYTPGTSNGGWPNFSETDAFGFGIDGDNDGQADLSWRDYGLNGRTQFRHLQPEREVLSVLSYGEYVFEGEFNLTPYFEAFYAKRDFFFRDSGLSLFALVPPGNPFNICNPDNAGGVDCGLAYDRMLTSPSFVAQFARQFADQCADRGLAPADCTPVEFGYLSGPLGPIPVEPIVKVSGDRTRVTTETDSWRWVGGIRADLPFMNVGSLSDWSVDASIAYSKSNSSSVRSGIRQDRLDLALGVYSTTNTPCENDIGQALADDAAPGCVPVNLFAPSLYKPLIGDFATRAERDYLFDNRDFATVYKQTIVNFYATGTLFDLPAGRVASGFGLEWRLDEIESLPDDAARDGLFFGFLGDYGAIGDKRIAEAFGEIEFPLLGNRKGIYELTLNLSVRYTDDEYYDGAWTGSGKVGWRPVQALLIRGTYGTSFRAPNLRELFLVPQSGYINVFDPCLIPEEALAEGTGGYDATRDRRQPHVLENCRAQGVDPTLASNGGFNSPSVELAIGGSLELEEETSDSWSLGFAFEQPFANGLLTIGASYYEADVGNAIIEPSPDFLVFQCYTTEEAVRKFCDRIRRDANPNAPLINHIDLGFINRDSEKVRGVDMNLTVDATLSLRERAIEIGFDANVHRLIEITQLFVSENGKRDVDTEHHDWFNPEYDGNLSLRLSHGRWSLTWAARYIGEQDDDPDNVDEWGDISTTADTCLGPPSDVRCRDLDYAGDYWLHSASVGYTEDWWEVRLGARNVFDKPPPQVDPSEAFGSTLNNAVIGAGFDYRGRYLFLTTEFRLGARSD